jgi:hypothetical protein
MLQLPIELRFSIADWLHDRPLLRLGQTSRTFSLLVDRVILGRLSPIPRHGTNPRKWYQVHRTSGTVFVDGEALSTEYVVKVSVDRDFAATIDIKGVCMLQNLGNRSSRKLGARVKDVFMSTTANRILVAMLLGGRLEGKLRVVLLWKHGSNALGGKTYPCAQRILHPSDIEYGVEFSVVYVRDDGTTWRIRQGPPLCEEPWATIPRSCISRDEVKAVTPYNSCIMLVLYSYGRLVFLDSATQEEVTVANDVVAIGSTIRCNVLCYIARN